MGGDGWLNACNSEGESSIPLNYRIPGLEGSSGSQLVHPAFRELHILSTRVIGPFLSLEDRLLSSPHSLQGQAIFLGLIHSPASC